MQSAPLVPFRMSLLLVPRMMLVPAGQQDTSSPSSAMTVVVFFVTLPAASRAVQVTIVVPSGNFAGASLVGVTGPQSSVAVGVPRFRPAAAGLFATSGYFGARAISSAEHVSNAFQPGTTWGSGGSDAERAGVMSERVAIGAAIAGGLAASVALWLFLAPTDR